MSLVEALDNYKAYPDTDSCYLDGRYFNLILPHLYQGVSTSPVMVSIMDNHEGSPSYISVEMSMTPIHMDKVNVFRVIISRSNRLRHSALLMLDPTVMRGVFWNPKSHTSNYDNLVVDMIQRALHLTQYNIEIDPDMVPSDPKPHSCVVSGYCNAYIIKKVLDQLMQRSFDPSHIKKFSYVIEQMFKDQLVGEPDEEYDVDFSPLGAGIGAVGGGAIGGIVAGPAGLVVGAVGGGLLGGFIGGSIDKKKNR